MTERRAARRFALGLLAFAAVLSAGWQLGVTREALAPVAVWNARITAVLLELQGVEVVRRGASLRHAGGFSAHLDPACTGLPVLALVLVAVGLSPVERRRRVRALALALPLVLALNLLRQLHLVRIGIEAPAWFDFAHDVAWRAAMALLLGAGWWLWRRIALAGYRIPSREPEGAACIRTGRAPRGHPASHVRSPS